MNILFVCKGNCSRSPMAEAYFRHLCKQNKLNGEVNCTSAGIKVDPESTSPEEAQEVMSSLGLTLENHTPKQISEDLVNNSDYIIAMSPSQVSELKKKFPSAKEDGKTRALLSFVDSDDEVDDPHRGDLETFQHCFLTMMPALAALADRILRSVK